MGRSTGKVSVYPKRQKLEKAEVRWAAKCTVEAMEQRVMLAVTPHIVTWNEEGPSVITGPNTGTVIPPQNGIGQNPAVGAISSVATLPNSSDIMYIGTVNGGIWRTLNGTTANPLWGSSSQFLSSLSIGAIMVDPFDNARDPIANVPTPVTAADIQTLADSLVIYAGTAVFSNGHVGGQRPGLFRSLDGGKTWFQPASHDAHGVDPFLGLDIQKIVASPTDPDTILVAVAPSEGGVDARAGIWVSNDARSVNPTFTQVVKGDATDLVADPGNANVFYAAVGGMTPGAAGRGVYRTNNGSSTAGVWTLMNGPAATPANTLNAGLTNGIDDDRNGNIDADGLEGLAHASRIRLAISNSGSGFALYAGLVGDTQNSNKLMGLFRSTDQAQNWSALPNFSPTASTPDVNSGGQGLINFSIVANPTNPNQVFIAGDNDPAGVAGVVFRATIGAGTVWEQVSSAGAAPGGVPTAPHPDTREMVFDSTGGVLEVDDGGIFRLNSPTAAANVRNWTSKNGTLRLGEFWSVARDPVTNTFFGGLQDIGVVEQGVTGLPLNNWTYQNPSGDGTISQIGGVGNAFHYSADNNFTLVRRNWNGTNLVSVQLPLGVIGSGPAGALLSLNGAGNMSNGAVPPNMVFDNAIPFLTQFSLDAVPPTVQANNRILIGTTDIYESFDDGNTLFPLDPLVNPGGGIQPPQTHGQVSAIAYGGFSGATPMPDVAYLGIAGRQFWVRSVMTRVGGNPSPTFGDFQQQAAYPGGEIRDIVLNPTDWTKGYVVDNKGDIYTFKNKGAAAADWTRITGDLGAKTNSLRSVEVIQTNNPNVVGGLLVLVGGRGGVFATFNPGAANPTWFQVGTNLPDTVVMDVRFDKTDGVLYCGTFGRGAWSISNFLAGFLPPAAAAVPDLPEGAPLGASATDPGTLEITGDGLANKNDTFRLVLNPANHNYLDVYVDNTTTTPDLTLPVSSVLRVSVTGGLGDDTLQIDDSNGTMSFANGIAFDQSGPGTNIQQEINQTPIDSGIVSKIRSGLQGLADFGASVAKVGELAQQIPGLGINLAQTFGLGDGSDPIGGVLKKGLVDPISNFFTTDATPTVQELVALIKKLSTPLSNSIAFGIDPLSVQGGIYTVGNHQEMRFTLDLNMDGFSKALAVDFSGALSSLGLSFSSSGKVNLDTSLDLSFSFGVDLTPGLSDADAFFINLYNMSASAHIGAGNFPPDDSSDSKEEDADGANTDQMSSDGLNFDANIGFLDAKVVNAAFELNADATVKLNDPNPSDGHITLAELKGTSLSSLVDLEFDGDFKAHLPVSVSLAGLQATSPTVDIESDDLFDKAPDVHVKNFDNLLNFNNLSPLAILGMLKQVGSFLETFKGSAALSTKIPFTSKTVGDILDIGNAFTDKLYKFLEPQPGKAAFDSAQGLADLLATTLGISPATVGAQYDAASNTLTYHVKIADAFAPTSLPVDLGLSLGSLAGLSTSSTIGVSASAGIEFTFGIILSAPSALLTGSSDAPANGRLASDAHFSVVVGGNDPVNVTVAADATNNSVDDLVADINTALSAAGLGDTVKAGRNGNKITFATQGLLTPSALTLNTTAGDSTETQLGFNDSQSASDSIGSRFFIKDASVTGSASLTATDINANAHLGFLGVGVAHGTGGVTASFNAQLVDPGTDAADGKITFNELFNALSNNVSSLVPTPTLSGSANLTLPLTVTPNIFGAGAPAAPAATVTWTDITDPNTLNVSFNADTSKLLDLQNLSFQGIIQAILQGVQYIASVEKTSFLNTKLPLLNKSVSEIIGAADQLLQKVNNAANASPAATLQDVANVLDTAMGLPANAITLTTDNKAIKVGIAFNAGGTYQIPINLDLATLAAGVPGLSEVTNLVDVTGAGNLTVGADASFNLNIGLDVTDPTSPKPFLYDDSNFHFDAKASGTGLNFSASVGPLGLFIKNGSVNLDGDGNPATNDSATFNVGIINDNGDGRHYFDELDTSDVSMTLVGQAHASLPIFFPTQTSPLNPPLAIAITDLSHISTTTTVTTPNLDVQFNSADLLSNVGAVLDGLDLLLGKVGDGVASQVLNHKLPLVGGNLKDAIKFIDNIRTNGIEPLKAQLGDKPSADALKNALFTALGPSGLGVLGDLDGNGTIDLNDVGIALKPDGSQILFTTRLHAAPAPLDVPVGFDVGLPGLGLNVDGSVQAKVGFDFKLAFGLNKTDGFFFVTDTRDASNNPVPEMNLSVDATTPGLSATGTLAVLQVKATDSTTTPSHLGASFSVDLMDPNNDGKLTMAELAAGPALSQIVKATLNASANINLHLVAGFGGGADFPDVSADLGVNWSFTNAPTSASDASFGNKPTVSFTNVQLNAGQFFSNFAKPILDEIQKVIKPIQPIIDILTTRLPVLSDISVARNLLDFDHDGSVTILDLVHLFNPDSKLDFITSLAKTVDLIDSIPTNLNNLMLNLGHFDIGSDLRSVTQLSSSDLANIVELDTSSQLAGSAASFNSAMASLNSVPGAGLKFPILSSPSSVFKLLIGQDLNLFTYDMPTLSANFQLSEFFPILGPLGARFTGSLGATAHFSFGYDTSGLREYIKASSSDRNLAMLLDGLYVSDRKNADGTGDDVPEATLTGGITAAAELNLGIASAGVSGGIFAKVNFNLHDPNNDGKVRFGELVSQFEKGPLAIFDVSGDLTAGLSAYISFLFSTKTFNLATVKLLDFNVDSSAATHPDPILATMLPGGVLQLNVGPNAAARQFGDLSDGDDTVTVTPGSSAGTITVEAFGFSQDFTGVSKIVADGGAGNDTITIKSGINIPASLSGGDGNDSLFGGDGGATLNGGAGDDQLSGGNGADSIVGGDGNDLMLGNGGSDSINGGVGDDTAEGGDGNDVIIGDVGNDVLSGGQGDDNIDGGDGNDALNGDDGNDTLTGDAGADQLDGGDGADSLLSGDGDDMITAGNGNDTAFGGTGNDSIDGGTGNDLIFGEAGFDTITDTTGNDTIDGGDDSDVISAGAGNDSITGGAGNDSIDAGDGNDYVDAGDGDDTIIGGIGNDTIIGGLGADNINAGSDSVAGSASDTNLIYGDNPTGTAGSADVIVGDIGNDTIHGGAGGDSISGLGGDDLIFGEDGDDSITGGTGNDSIDGGDGSDILSGQEGDDVISGDNGLDYVSGDAGNDLLWGGAALFDRATFMAGGFAADGVTPLILNGASVDGLATDGQDSVLGGSGNDWAFGGGDSDQVYGGDGNDYVDAGAGNDTAQGDAGNDVVRGGGNDDLVRGGAGIDQVYGDDGNDSLYGDAGDASGSVVGQKLWGGAGNDVLFAYAATTLASEFTLTGDELHGGDGNDTLNGNIRKEKLFGDDGNDLILGDILSGPLYANNPQPTTFGAADSIFGGAGEDQIFGGGGNDTMFGGADSDRLEGQDGADVMYGGSSIDVIVLDVDPTYTTSGDVFDGHFGNDAQGDVPDDNATDILLINGTNGNDTIKIGESAGKLNVNYNGRIIPATWRDANNVPLVEQISVSGLNGNDDIEFLSGAGGIDVSALSARSTDFVGVIDGGAGNDTLIGTNGRDRLDGGRGSDVVQGMAGDDRLFGDGGAGQGDLTDFDQLFAGQGNDDLIGGQGTNSLYAWSQDPTLGAQFGVFVDPQGGLHNDDGDLNNDGKLDSDPSKAPYVLEDTGMNRMLGSAQSGDKLFGGTGLDFLYGNGGQDQLFNRDGTPFENMDDNGVAGQEWKDYAKSTGKVWYVGGSNLDDIITVDFVTEPGALAGHHLVTRLTNNNGNFTFAAQVELDFEAHNPDGSLVWDPTKLVFDPNTLSYDNQSAYANLLPPEGDFQAIIIDALGGNDTITVGPTVTKSVWIDGGDGNDHVSIKSGNPILPDQLEGTTRNDTRQTAHNFTTDANIGTISANRLLTGMSLDSPTDVDFYKFRLAAAISGNLAVTSLSASDGMVLQILDANGNLLRTSAGGVVSLTGLAAGTDFFLRVNSNLNPTIYQLAFAVTTNPVTTNVSNQTVILRRDIILGGAGDDVLSGGSGEDWVLGGDGNDVLTGGLDRQASDLLFGEAGDDTFQIIPDALPLIPGTDRTLVPTLTDSFDGGTGNDRVLFLGGDLDSNSKPVPDTVAIKYNTQLHRYEFTSLIWDTANQKYETDAAGNPKQLFSFYQAQNVENTVIDTRAGDDEIHADPGYTLGGVTYGINVGDFQQNAKIAGLTILGGDGNDRIFGGAMGDSIDGGAGNDYISGGGGNDSITGGGGNDVLAGNVAVAPDPYEFQTRNGVSGRNDDSTFAANLGSITPGQTISGLTLNLGDTGDWYFFKTPDALLRLGNSQAAYLTSSMITVTRSDSGPTQFFLFAGRQADPNDPNSIVPVERPTGVPAFYMIHVVRTVNPVDGSTPAEIPGTYSIQFSSQIGKTVQVPPTQADFTINSANPGDQPAVIPLGDINGDGRVDFIGAIQDYTGSLADYKNASNFNDYPGNSADYLPPSYARIYFGGTSIGNTTLPVNAVTLKLPAPVAAPSFFGSQTIFANPADYNGDGISDIAVAVTLTSRYFPNEAPFLKEGVYIIFGRAGGFSGTIDVVRDADVTLRGFAPAGNSSADTDDRLSIAGVDVNNDGFDDLLVGNRALTVGGQVDAGATYLFLGRSKANWNAVTNRVVFNADFNDTSGLPSADGFTIDNSGTTTAGLWHVSTGQNTVPGHTANGDMYFGAGETTTTAGTYDGPSMAGRITSPTISLAGLSTATLNFNYFLSTEAITSNSIDRARVLISTNNGASFTPLQVRDQSGNLRDAGAANRVLVNSGKTTQPGLLSDPTNGWINASFDLTPYVGNTQVKIQFDFLSNATANNFEGWYVDDVTVSGALLTPAQANATFTGSGATELVGSAVSGIGDFNHDGKKDFAIMRAGTDSTNAGQAYVILGRGTADAAFTSGPVSNVASFILRGNNSFSGYGIAAAGDVDGDGFGDFLITPSSGPTLLTRFGSPPPVSLIFGRSGLTGVNLISSLSGILQTSHDGGWVALGDVNGDGFADLGANSIHSTSPLSESTSSLNQIRHSAGEIFFGRANARNTMSLDTPDLVIEPGKPNYDSPAFRPNIFNSPGDINKDGKSDFIFADSFGGFSRVYLGQALQPAVAGTGGGSVTLPNQDFQYPLSDPSSGPAPANPPGLNLATSGPAPDAGNAFEIHGSQSAEHLSNPRSAGDINGDGIDDLIVDGTLHSYVIFGPADINGRINVLDRANIILDRSDGVFAQRMADIDGDGVNDLIFYNSVVSPSDPTLYNLTVGVILSKSISTTLLPHHLTMANATRTVSFYNGFHFDATSAAADRTFSVAGLKFNDDNFGDILITARGLGDDAADVVSGARLLSKSDGAVRINEPLFDGTVFLGNELPYLRIGRDTSDRAAVQTQLYGTRNGGYAGSSQQQLSSVVVGDVNGDGLEDIVFADKGYAVDLGAGNVQVTPNVGRAYLFLGTKNNAIPERQPVRSLDGADRVYQGASFGENVSAVGDVNGDGYADFAVSRTREGNSLTPSSLLFFYGRPTIAGATISADAAANQYVKKAGDVASSVILDGALYATTGDFNGDGKLDLAVGEPKRTVLNAQNVVLDVSQQGAVYIFFSIADRAKGLSLTSPDRIINGEGEFDQFGVLTSTGPVDLDRDHVADLLIGAPGADVVSPSLIPGAGKVYVVYDGVVAPTAPPGTSVGELSNQTVTGDGDFISDPGTHQPIVFKDPDANNDGIPDTTNYVLSAGQSEKWYSFTTLGDGQADSSIRITPPPLEQTTTLQHGKDTGVTTSQNITSPSDPVIRVDGSTALTPGTPPSPAGETVDHLFDGFTQKYLNLTLGGSGAIITPQANGGQGTIINGIRFFTANDAVQRDPTSYELDGTNDDLSVGTPTWTALPQGVAINLPAGRNPTGNVPVDPNSQFNQTIYFNNTTAYKSYRIRFFDFKNSPSAADAMQIGEVQLLADTSTFHVGGASNDLGLFEFDLSPWLKYADQPSLIQGAKLQLDYQNAVFTTGQSLSVFIGNAESDGVVSPADATAAATLAGQRTFVAGDPTSGLLQIDITSAIRAAIAAGKTRIMLRLAASSTSVSMNVQSAASTSRQTGLAVTEARQQGVLADLIDPAGNVLARGLSTISLRPFKAGHYLLRIYDPFGAAPSAIPFSIEMKVPVAGNSYADADRDQISGGDGEDTLTGNGGLDRLNGNSGNDAFVGDDVEAIDQQTGDSRQNPDPTQASNIPVAQIDPVVTIPDPGLRSAIADALGIGHTASSTGFTRPFLASQLAQIRTLDASNRQILDLTGLEQLINLESLNLSHNSLAALDFVDVNTFHHGLLGLTRLTSLDLSYNRISDTSLSTLAGETSLKSLNLDGNRLRTVTPLSALTNLTFLSIDGPISPFAVLPGPSRGNDLLGKFINPSPANGDAFGYAVTQVGQDIAISDPNDGTVGTNAGAVYIYDGTSGQLKMTLQGTAAGDQFGFSLASSGNLLLIGAPGAKGAPSLPNTGAVFIYDISTGRFLGNLNVPNPFFSSANKQFGYSMAVIGQNVVVGAPNDFGNVAGSGAAYLFNIATHSTLAQLYPNSPAGAAGDRFGAAVAGTADEIFVGAPGHDTTATDAGAVYVFAAPASASGTNFLINNPLTAASSAFGSSLAIVGGNLAIGAPGAKSSAGMVHLFNDVTGAFVRSIDIPVAQGTGPVFGSALAAYDDTRLVVGAPSNAFGAGAVYLIDTNTGAALQTFNGTTALSFGESVAIVNGDIMVGTPGDQVAGNIVGSASLFKGPRITDASALASLSNLKSLSLSDQRLIDVSAFSSPNLANLQSLNLQDNQIGGNIGSLLTLPALTTLSLDHNPLDNTSFTSSIPSLTAKLTTFTFNPDQAPVIQPITPVATTVGTPATITISATDPDSGDAVFLGAASSDNPNVTVQLVGNQLTLTPAGGFTGVAHITVTFFDGPSGALDWRGRSASRTFDFSVGLAAITGAKFNDFNNNGVRDPGDTGVAGWQLFIDSNNNGVFDTGEPLTATDADGNYAFTGLLPGTYTVGEIGLSAWFPTAPRTVLSANFTSGAQNFTNSGASDPWHVTTLRGTDAGHTGTQSFYFGSDATNTYANSSSGTLTSPVIDLRNTAGPVRLDFNQFLATATGTTPLSSADFSTTTAGTTASADGYTGTGLWHISSSRSTTAGHSANFSAYFGSETTHQYTASSTGLLTSPVINLTGVTGKVTLNLDYFLNAAGTNGGIGFGTGDAASIGVLVNGNTTLLATNLGTKPRLLNTTSFTSLALNLTQFDGQQIQLVFGFTADSDRRLGEGFYVDDVNVSLASADVATVGVLANGVFTPLADSTSGLPNNTGVWNPVTFDLSSFDGQQIQLQYKFSADSTLNAEGWYIDDPKVTIGVTTQITLAAGQVATGIDFGGLMVPNIGPDQSVTTGQTVNITPVITDPNPLDGSDFSYSWNVVASNGQTIPGATTSNYSFTPNQPGTYTVSLTLTDLDDGNKVYVDTAVYTVTGDPAGLTASPGATYTITGPANAPVLNVLTGTVMVSPQLYTTFPNLGATVANGATLNLTGSQHLASLTLATGSFTSLLGGATLTLNGISLTGSARLDLGTGYLIYNYQAGQGTAALALIAGLIKTGYNNGSWGGAGISSSTAALTPTSRAIGFQNNNNGAGGAIHSSFGGQTAQANSIVARFTSTADSNLDGTINFADLVAVAQHYGQGSATWAGGDFNFDNTVSFADLVAVAQRYGQSLPAGASEVVIPVTSTPTTDNATPVVSDTSAGQTISPSSETSQTPAAPPIAKPQPASVTWVPVSKPAAVAAAPAPAMAAVNFVPVTPTPAAKVALPSISLAVATPLPVVKPTPAAKPRATFSSAAIATKKPARTTSAPSRNIIAQTQVTPTPTSPFSVTRTRVKNELLD